MSTTAQQLSAAANAQLSTGPRTPEGKAISARNSLKLGLYSQAALLPGEDPEEFAQLSRDFEAQFPPANPVEAQILADLIRGIWLVRRCQRIEAQVINARAAALSPDDNAHPLGAVFIQDAEGPGVLEKIFRRHQAAHRQYTRALTQLCNLHAARSCPGPDPVVARSYTGGPTPFSTPRDNWDNPALRL
jgi:hypothetical protein